MLVMLSILFYLFLFVSPGAHFAELPRSLYTAHHGMNDNILKANICLCCKQIEVTEVWKFGGQARLHVLFSCVDPREGMHVKHEIIIPNSIKT